MRRCAIVYPMLPFCHTLIVIRFSCLFLTLVDSRNRAPGVNRKGQENLKRTSSSIILSQKDCTEVLGTDEIFLCIFWKMLEVQKNFRKNLQKFEQKYEENFAKLWETCRRHLIECKKKN